jgi:ABC-type bacteriocin/lantibiotic exporter with double-glycine peptidase domain
MNCGAICLQHVHREHGNRLSLTRSRKLCKTTRKGTFAADLIDALEQLGYKRPRLVQNLAWRELKRLVDTGNDVFLAWWSDLDSNGIPSPADGHWSVAKKVTRDTITLFDPDPEEAITLPRLAFESKWHDYERDHAGRKDFIRAAVIAKYPARSPIAHK